MKKSPMYPSIDALRDEFRRTDLRGPLWSWLYDVLGDFARIRLARYRPAIYSPSGVWDNDGISDLVNGFLMERGIERGAVQRALLAANDTVGAIRYLEAAFHRYAISERLRTVSSNIFGRLRDVLAGDARFYRVGNGRREVFGVAPAREKLPTLLAPDELSYAARYIPGDIRWFEYRTGDRLSPGITNEVLGRIAEAVMRGSDRLLSASQLMRLIRDRFGLIDDGATTSSIEVHASLSTKGPDPLEHALAADIASKALSRLTSRQRNVLRAWVSGDSQRSVREIAHELGISKSLVSKIQGEIGLAFRQLCVTGADERRQIFDAVASLLEA